MRWPLGWRPTKTGGVGFNPLSRFWRANTKYRPGNTVEGRNGLLYMATTDGLSDPNKQPSWPSTPIGTMVKDYQQIWKYMGIAPDPSKANSDPAPDPSMFEPILDCSPTMLKKDCSNAREISLSDEEIAHARYKLTVAPDSPAQDFTIFIGSGVAGSWDRVVYNATPNTCTVKTKSGDVHAGIVIPKYTAYRLMNDGTQIIRVQ
jgi:hypothetical protein